MVHGAGPLIVLLCVGLWVLMWVHDDVRQLTRDYACPDPFSGALYPSLVRFAMHEHRTDCLLGANRQGLYLTSSAAALAHSKRWSRHHDALRTALWIPWADIHYVKARFPLRNSIKFQVTSNRSCFFVPGSDAKRLLQEAGLPLP